MSELAEIHTGQALSRTKHYLFERRLEGVLGLTGYEDADQLASYLSDCGEGANLESAVATALLDRRSRFVSERGEFCALLDSHIEPSLVRDDKAHLRIWCAGCGGGQEAYSFLMLMNNRYSPDFMERIEIVATDLTHEALVKAEAGIYSHYEVQTGLSVRNLLRYFHGLRNGSWRISPGLTRKISFQNHNLLTEAVEFDKFDLVICRNVLGGMTASQRERALRVLQMHVKPGGRCHCV